MTMSKLYKTLQSKITVKFRMKTHACGKNKNVMLNTKR